jgi:hypothetical protein
VPRRKQFIKAAPFFAEFGTGRSANVNISMQRCLTLALFVFMEKEITEMRETLTFILDGINKHKFENVRDAAMAADILVNAIRTASEIKVGSNK